MMQYAKRRKAVLDAMEVGGIAVLYSGESVPANLDASLPFAENSNFFYLTGLRRENMALVLMKNSLGSNAVLFIEEAVPSMERWTGKRMTAAEARAVCGIRDIRLIGSIADFISRAITREGIGACAYFDTNRNHMTDLDSYNMTKAKAFMAAYPGIPMKNLHPMIAALRMRKDEDEAQALRESIAITDKALRRVLNTLEPGQMEYQAQAEFEYIVKREGAELSFPTIAGSGSNGCMLHYVTNHCKMEPDTLLLMDLGARKNGYCADITRTYPVSGKFTERQRQFYDIVLKANRVVAETAKPGMTTGELNNVCKKVLAEGMIALGKIQKEEEIGKYYMHGVSHHLGIDTHDANTGDAVKLEAGMVISDEPGLYVDEEGIGIRIEDDLLITEDGCEVLSETIARTAEEIEALMARK